MIREIYKIFVNIIILPSLHILFKEQWFIAFREGNCDGERESKQYIYRYLYPPGDRYWADPFLVKLEDKYYMFFEEFFYHSKKGRIMTREMGKKGNWKAPQIAIEMPYHLSYPCIFVRGKEIFMIPETHKNRSIELWRCVEFPCKWKHECNLMENIVATDSTIIEINEIIWMFTCMFNEDTSKFDRLFLFYARDPQGPWTPHPQNPIVTGEKQARPAGRPFFTNGIWMRPAQDCSKRYGYRIIINEILLLNTEQYIEREVSSIDPNWKRGLLATHSIDKNNDNMVIDGLRRIPRIRIWSL